jgi:cell division protein FtsI (penicillin-binding protein 3)
MKSSDFPPRFQFKPRPIPTSTVVPLNSKTSIQAQTAQPEKAQPEKAQPTAPATVGVPPKKIRPKQHRCHPNRLQLVWLALLMGMAGLAVNLFRLQISQGQLLKQRAQYQQSVHSSHFVPRRPMSDADGNILAIDRLVYTLYAHPHLFKYSTGEIASQLAPMLLREDLTTPTATELLEQFNQAESGIKVAEFLTEEVTNRIKNLRIDGLEFTQHRQRLYPQEEIAADIIGYVNGDGIGQAGVEFSQHELLERSMSTLQLKRAVDGTWVPDQLATGFVQLDDLELRLTIETRLQRVVGSILNKHVKRHGAKRGTVIILDAKDGSIVSLVNSPSYDPNEYYKFDIERFKNWALSDLYEPGSTFKPINIALALESGVIQPDDYIYDEGRIYMGKWVLQNADYPYAGPYGTISITDVIKYSSNVSMVRIMQKLEPEVYYEGLKRLGLDDMMEVDLPFEVSSNLKSRRQFIYVPVEAATTSFGQGFSITPLKLAQLYGVLANGGKLVTPHVVQGLYNSNGQNYWEPPLPEPRQVFSEETTQAVLEMMETVVEDGTGKNAQIPGYRIAGKTGTAEKADERGGYSDSAKITSFVGVLSVNQPRYVVLAAIDEPRTRNASGGKVAAPIVKEVMKELISAKRIPPSPEWLEQQNNHNQAEYGQQY